MPGPSHGHAVPVHRRRGLGRRPAHGTAVGRGPPRLPVTRPRRGQMSLFRSRAGRPVRPLRRRRRRRAVRARVRQVDGPRAGGTATAVQDVRPGRAVRAARVGVRAERGAGPGSGAVGTAPGVQVRRAEAAGQQPELLATAAGHRGQKRQAGHADTDVVAGARAAGRAHRPARVLR